MSNDKTYIPAIDWRPSDAARIDPDPPRPRTFAQSTMSDTDYDAAQDEARAGRAVPGTLRDWGSIPPESSATPPT